MLIFDTDPGVDDTLALLLLLSEPRVRHELKLVTLTFGNCPLRQTLRNVLSLFAVLSREQQDRAREGLQPFTDQRPAVHIGERGPLTAAQHTAAEGDNAEDVHGSDGLAGVHARHPEFDAPPEWFELFEHGKEGAAAAGADADLPFVPGKTPSYQAILDVLASEPPNTVTIVAVGPLTNLALAAEHDLTTFKRVKQVLSMGAAVRAPGNITPFAEFNVLADPLAAAQVYALTSPHPATTMPAALPLPADGANPLNLVLFPLDITMQHQLHLADVQRALTDHGTRRKSVLAQWVGAWLVPAFSNYGRITGHGPENAVVSLHDPLTAMYALEPALGWTVERLDVRVETEGQWTRGMTVIDRRALPRGPRANDRGLWLTPGEGNDVGIVVDSPIKRDFCAMLLARVLG